MDTQAIKVKEGMTVLDSTGEKIGTVDGIQFSDENPRQPGPETTRAIDNDASTTPGFFQDLVEALTGSVDLPDEVASRLIRAGYIRIDGNLTHSDAYATMAQIARTEDDEVHLTVEADQLVSV